MRTTLKSGFCSLNSPELSHRRCPVQLGTAKYPATCDCVCHKPRVRMETALIEAGDCYRCERPFERHLFLDAGWVTCP